MRPNRTSLTPSRRSFLVGGAALAGTFAGRAHASPRARLGLVPWLASADDGDGPTLVVVQLSGGNDGLNTIVPYADDLYYGARKKVRVEASDVLKIDDYRGFHPLWPNLRGLWDRGELALVEGVGYPNPNRSHFASFDIWHAADLRGRAAGYGWLTRLGARLQEGSAPEATTAVHVGARLPYSMYSPKYPSVCFPDPELYQWDRHEESISGVARLEGDADAGGGMGGEADPLERLRSTVQQAKASSRAIRTAAREYRPRVDYPGDGLGAALRSVAALIRKGIGARILSVELAGFDTHVREVPTHERLLSSVDDALTAFLEDLRGTPEGERTLTMIFSEFGRRVADNASEGTDHGTAGPLFLAGPMVAGGLYGRYPSLAELDEGDLLFDTDFRSVYTTVIEDWFGLPANDVVEGTFPKLPLLRA